MGIFSPFGPRVRLNWVLNQKTSVHRKRARLLMPGMGNAMATLKIRWTPRCLVASLADSDARRTRSSAASAGAMRDSFCHRSIPLLKKSSAAVSEPDSEPIMC